MDALDIQMSGISAATPAASSILEWCGIQATMAAGDLFWLSGQQAAAVPSASGRCCAEEECVPHDAVRSAKEEQVSAAGAARRGVALLPRCCFARPRAGRVLRAEIR